MTRRHALKSAVLIVVVPLVVLIAAGPSAEREPTAAERKEAPRVEEKKAASEGNKKTTPVGEAVGKEKAPAVGEAVGKEKAPAVKKETAPPLLQKAPRRAPAPPSPKTRMKARDVKPLVIPPPKAKALGRLPDLVHYLRIGPVELSSKDVSRGDRVRIDFRIDNFGDARVVEVPYRVSIGHLLVDEGTARDIPAGGNVSVSRLFTVPGAESVCGHASYHIRIYTPPWREESHLLGSMRIRCPALHGPIIEGIPEIRLGAVELSTTEVSRADRVRVDFRIENEGDTSVEEVPYEVRISESRDYYSGPDDFLPGSLFNHTYVAHVVDQGMARDIPAGGQVPVSRLVTIPGSADVCGWERVIVRLQPGTENARSLRRPIQVDCSPD